MVQKRQLADEEYDVSPKHLKLENSCQLVSCLEFPAHDVPLKPCISGITEGCFSKETFESDFQFEDIKLEVPFVTPEFDSLKPRTLMKPEDAYSCLLRRSPLKEVPVGPEYQAEIPEWCEYDTKNDANKFMGYCVISMPEADTTICNNDVVGRGRTGCWCEDPGSFICVQHHIREARENLRGNIGNRRFSELGFCSMGDVVSCKWTEEDEHLFHEVVYSNPVSLGKNFWVHLAEAFPSRTNHEIVSYYFNVFVLQRRAEQNRCDPANADSDDDEWQGSDQSEEDEDFCQDAFQTHGCFGIENAVSEAQPAAFNSCSFDSSQASEKTQADESGGDCDFQEDSCTSSEIEPQSSKVNVDCSKPWTNHDFIFEPSDPKVWDVGYFSFPSNKTDFLSTGNMIEEVFGVESWNIKVTDKNKGSSEYN